MSLRKMLTNLFSEQTDHQRW